MEIIGIICEYNPFHNGHLYQIKKIKETYKDCLIIAIMSGNFTQRADISILSKEDKADVIINNGIDLVIEIPCFYVVQSADIFSYAAVKLAKMIGCTKLCFGAEHSDINFFLKNINILNTDNYNVEVKKFLKKGYNYPTSTSKALKIFGGELVNLPNDILALRYIREITNNKYDIEPIIIKRTNDYHDIDSNEKIISASNIRKKIRENIDIKKYVPVNVYEKINNSNIKYIENYFELFKYNVLNNINNLDEFLEVNFDLSNRIKKHIYDINNYSEYINKICSKNITISKLKRVFVHILLSMKKDSKYDIEYIRILNFNKKGQEYLNKIKKEVTLVTNFKMLNDYDKQIDKLINFLI